MQMEIVVFHGVHFNVVRKRDFKVTLVSNIRIHYKFMSCVCAFEVCRRLRHESLNLQKLPIMTSCMLQRDVTRGILYPPRIQRLRPSNDRYFNEYSKVATVYNLLRPIANV